MSESDLSQRHSPKIAPSPKLSSRGLVMALLTTCILPLTVLSVYAAIYGRASQHRLDVVARLDVQLVRTKGGQGAIPTEVVVIENLSTDEIPNLTVDLNGQYFLYQESPLGRGETLVVPQSIFATKSNQRFKPKGPYPITEVTVTGRLPSGARGVTEFAFEPAEQED
ncbi:MAG: hypothetical protein AAF989_12485 [Planctomycetota bacterium]